jgi:hypothetical protein
MALRHFCPNGQPAHIGMQQGVIDTYDGFANACTDFFFLFQSLMLVDSEPLSSNLGSLKRAAALLTAIRDSQLSQG